MPCFDRRAQCPALRASCFAASAPSTQEVDRPGPGGAGLGWRSALPRSKRHACCRARWPARPCCRSCASLRDDADARTALDVARALVQAGARAIVAADDGAAGRRAEVVRRRMAAVLQRDDQSAQAAAQRRRARARVLAAERVDIVHAKNAGAAWSALAAATAASVRLVTDLPDLPRQRMRLAALSARRAQPRRPHHRALAVHGAADDGPLSHSAASASASSRAASTPRGSIPRRCIPTASPRCARPGAFRRGVRIVLVPGRVAPWNGQLTLVKAARMLADGGMRGVTFVFAGDDRRYRSYVRPSSGAPRAEGVDALFRLVGHCADMPAAYAASDIVVVPARVPPIYGPVVAEAQAMARPVIASAIGPIAGEYAGAAADAGRLRTGWVVPPRDPAADRAMRSDCAGARRRSTGPSRRAPRHSANSCSRRGARAAATLEVYTSLLKAEP